MTVPDRSIETLPALDYEAMRAALRTGDVLLCSGTQIFSRVIRWATRSPWSHVAMVLRLDLLDEVMIIEAVEHYGVRLIPFHRWLTENKTKARVFPGDLVVARHRRFEERAQGEAMRHLGKFATSRLGTPFGAGEIVKIMVRIVAGHWNRRMPRLLRSDDEFICSEFLYRCYQQIGIEIPWNGLGFIGPDAFAKDPEFDPVVRLAHHAFDDDHPVNVR
ncbi:YiiX/YebB-like N1pC/P60 family cysteine hydrolase [Sphingomonas sp. KR3-1]|uniref:YiiX/YebB-like N1pC/P60 family cysteine hydrolase n=1 Tax=Sphingomonas sp. KR3-1 TaxID=3156611 RepID=UPI0032B44C0F